MERAPLLSIERRTLLRRAITVAGGAMVSAFFPFDAALAAKKKKKRKKRKSKPSFFNSKETRSRNFKPFKKWKAAIKRYSKEKASQTPGSCKSKKLTKCHFDEWEKFIAKTKTKKPKSQIVAVNGYMNKARYITDQNNWGKKDYWASPGEFMARFGDCEDFAIAKYMTLKKLGFKVRDMRVVAVKDMNLKVGHAILVVFHEGKPLMLDNQVRQVVKASSVKHYQPVFSINEKYWWRHRVAKS